MSSSSLLNGNNPSQNVSNHQYQNENQSNQSGISNKIKSEKHSANNNDGSHTNNSLP